MGNVLYVTDGAPWWLYLLFIYLVIVGLRAIKPRPVTIIRVVLLPLFLLAWALNDLYAKVNLGFAFLILVWIGFLRLGIYLGVTEVQSWHISKNLKGDYKGEITIPGNYTTLVLIILIFAFKIFWAYFYTTRPDISYTLLFDAITSSLITGFFVGQAAVFFKKFQK